MADHVQCEKCYEVKEVKEVKDNGNTCPEQGCGGKSFRDT
jgi:hypothetical protein